MKTDQAFYGSALTGKKACNGQITGVRDLYNMAMGHQQMCFLRVELFIHLLWRPIEVFGWAHTHGLYRQLPDGSIKKLQFLPGAGNNILVGNRVYASNGLVWTWKTGAKRVFYFMTLPPRKPLASLMIRTMLLLLILTMFLQFAKIISDESGLEVVARELQV